MVRVAGYTASEAAALLGTSRQCVYEQVQRGTLPAIAVQGDRVMFRIPRAALQRYRRLRQRGGVCNAERCPGDLTLREVAALCQVHLNVPYIWRTRGILPTHTHGNRLVARRADVITILTARKRKEQR